MLKYFNKNLLSALKYVKLPLLLCLFFLISAASLQVTGLSVRIYLLTKLINSILIISLAWLAIRLVFFGRKRLEEFLRFSGKKDNLRERRVFTQILYIEKIIFIFIIFLACVALLMNFNSLRDIGIGLLTSAGAASIIIGIAAQKSLANILAGFQIAFTQPLRIDDSVVVEGEWGWIEDITLTYVTIRLWDWRRLVVPITYFIEKPFQNWTKKTANVIGSVFLYADYSLDIEALRAKLKDILQTTNLWDGSVQVVQVTDAKSDSIELRVLVSASSAPQAWDLRCYVREKLVKYINEVQSNSLPRTRVNLVNTAAMQEATQ